MANGTGRRPPGEQGKGVEFSALPTRVRHRTSAPTNTALYALLGDVKASRSRASADLLIFAALRIAKRQPDTLMAEISRIEAERFPVSPLPVEQDS